MSANYEPDTDEDEEAATAQGYWGDVRDTGADRRHPRRFHSVNGLLGGQEPAIKYYYDGFWGSIKDLHLDQVVKIEEEEEERSVGANSANNSQPDQTEELRFSVDEKKTSKKFMYDYKRSKFKIEAQKRDDAKVRFCFKGFKNYLIRGKYILW